MEKYTEGLFMEQFTHVPQISSYNHNYYIGFDNDLIYAKSNDDNLTEYWLVKNESFTFFGYSFESEDSKLHATTERVF